MRLILSVCLLLPTRLLLIALCCLAVYSVQGAVKKFGVTFKTAKDLKPFTCMGGKLKLDVKNSTVKNPGSLTREPDTHIECKRFTTVHIV